MSFLGIRLFRTTDEHAQYWRDRKIDWKTSYLDTWNHPHRFMISAILKTFPWMSLVELGSGPGPNLVNIIKHFTGKQVGGCDVNPEAIELAQQTFKGGYFKVCPVDDVMMSDNSVDVVLTDMCLIYISPHRMEKVMHEIKRIARHYVVLCEFHEPNWFKRMMVKYRSGYYAHDYKSLLEKHGFYDIIMYKIPPDAWPGGGYQEKIGYVVVAKAPKRK